MGQQDGGIATAGSGVVCLVVMQEGLLQLNETYKQTLPALLA
jgi:hypothetical protein